MSLEIYSIIISVLKGEFLIYLLKNKNPSETLNEFEIDISEDRIII